MVAEQAIAPSPRDKHKGLGGGVGSLAVRCLDGLSRRLDAQWRTAQPSARIRAETLKRIPVLCRNLKVSVHVWCAKRIWFRHMSDDSIEEAILLLLASCMQGVSGGPAPMLWSYPHSFHTSNNRPHMARTRELGSGANIPCTALGPTEKNCWGGNPPLPMSMN
jgi:hypothetical protein